MSDVLKSSANANPSEDEIRRVNGAISLLPRVRALRELLELIDRQPMFPDAVSLSAKVQSELDAAERDVLGALTGRYE